jgi:hypothetical protein
MRFNEVLPAIFGFAAGAFTLFAVGATNEGWLAAILMCIVVMALANIIFNDAEPIE